MCSSVSAGSKSEPTTDAPNVDKGRPLTLRPEERKLLWEVVMELAREGLVAGSNGNASMRLDDDTLLITPTGRSYRAMTPEDLLIIDMDGGPVEGEGVPSSETALHLAIYQARPDAGAVIHTHSAYATIAAVAALDIPPLVDEVVYKVGGSIPVADYAFPSTEELASKVVGALGEVNAVLLRNHGLVGLGRNPWEAFDLCQLVERLAHTFIYATLLGRANPIPPEYVDLEQELFRMKRRASIA